MGSVQGVWLDDLLKAVCFQREVKDWREYRDDPLISGRVGQNWGG